MENLLEKFQFQFYHVCIFKCCCCCCCCIHIPHTSIHLLRLHCISFGAFNVVRLGGKNQLKVSSFAKLCQCWQYVKFLHCNRVIMTGPSSSSSLQKKNKTENCFLTCDESLCCNLNDCISTLQHQLQHRIASLRIHLSSLLGN